MGFRLPKTRGMLRREAAGWLARLQSGRDSGAQRKFQAWRDADPRNAAAFERVQRSYEQAGLLRQSAPIARAVPTPPRRTRAWQLRTAVAAAAAFVLVVPVGVLIVRNGHIGLGGTDTLMLMTSVGQIKQVELPDGSRVTLDTATKIDVEIRGSRRSAHFRYGRARFQVAPSTVPFVVDTHKSMVTARAGVIDVEESARRDIVHVLAGAAEVRSPSLGPSSAVALGSGESVLVGAGGPEQTDALPASDWTRGMLQFDGTPLADAVALANRYSQRHIVLAGDLSTLRVTGAFRAGDIAGLAKAFAAAFHLSLEQRANGDLLLSRGPSAAASE